MPILTNSGPGSAKLHLTQGLSPVWIWSIHRRCSFLKHSSQSRFVIRLDLLISLQHIGSVVQYLFHLSSFRIVYWISQSYLFALSYHCKLQGIHDPTSEIQITKLLQGMKRLNHKSDRRLPITKNILDFFLLFLVHAQILLKQLSFPQHLH